MSDKKPLALADAERRADEWQVKHDQERTKRYAVENEAKETRKQFDDLKMRLHAAETSNQFMRGYLARVKEDDVVREELIATGEPGGEQQLVPKRKPTNFPRPDDFSVFKDEDRFGLSTYMSDEDRRRRAKHWITY